MDQIYLSLGIIGSLIGLLGTLPQILHLYKIKDSTGQSLIAWYVWNLSNIVLLIYAIHIFDPIFIFLEASWLVFCTIVIVMIYTYRRKDEVTA